MNDSWGYENGSAEGQGEDTELSGPKALREAYKALKAQNDEFKTMLTSLVEDQQKAKVQTVFETLGVPQAAPLYKGDADPQKAAEWVNQMQSVFGGNQGMTPQVAAATPGLEPGTQDQFQRLTQAGADAASLGTVEAANAAAASATSLDDLKAIWANGQFS